MHNLIIFNEAMTNMAHRPNIGRSIFNIKTLCLILSNENDEKNYYSE